MATGDKGHTLTNHLVQTTTTCGHSGNAALCEERSKKLFNKGLVSVYRLLEVSWLSFAEIASFQHSRRNAKLFQRRREINVSQRRNHFTFAHIVILGERVQGTEKRTVFRLPTLCSGRVPLKALLGVLLLWRGVRGDSGMDMFFLDISCWSNPVLSCTSRNFDQQLPSSLKFYSAVSAGHNAWLTQRQG